MMPSRVLVSGPKRCWSNEYSNLIFGAPVLPVRNKTMAGFAAPWLRGNRQFITFMVFQFITFMVKFYKIFVHNNRQCLTTVKGVRLHFNFRSMAKAQASVHVANVQAGHGHRQLPSELGPERSRKVFAPAKPY